MCTVTFIPSNKQVILTSNRDEKHWRTAADYPEAYPFPSGRIIFPKDGDAGGTWFAVHENGNALVFLNGAFIKHIPQPPYRKSRGLILLELLDREFPSQAFLDFQLDKIEPFTAVIWEDGKLIECRWDGREKYQSALSTDAPHIWSSATLYDEEVVMKRSSWFNLWLENHSCPTQQEILNFHQFTGDGDQYNDLMMNRDGKVFTVSITSALIGENKITMQYLDLMQGNLVERDFPIINARVKA